jgi:hypothetical protein
MDEGFFPVKNTFLFRKILLPLLPLPLLPPLPPPFFGENETAGPFVREEIRGDNGGSKRIETDRQLL